MAKHNTCGSLGVMMPDGCWVPIALPGGAIDGQSLIFDSSSPLQLAWGPIAKGDRGEPGPPGSPGRDGRDGVNGLNGLPGAPGRDGAQGIQGVPGKDGIDGRDGRDGQNGQNGITPHIGVNGNWFIGEFDTNVRAAGIDGADGADGRMGPQGNPGTPGMQGVAGPPGPVTITPQQVADVFARIEALEAQIANLTGVMP